MGGSAGKLTVAAGLFGLAAVLKLVVMLSETAQNTAADWVTVALLAATALAMAGTVMRMRRARPDGADEHHRR